MCSDSIEALYLSEDTMTMVDGERDNCGIMSPYTQILDMQKANEKILSYIDSIVGKQTVITSSQISKELGISQGFVEAILIANGFEEND